MTRSPDSRKAQNNNPDGLFHSFVEKSGGSTVTSLATRHRSLYLSFRSTEGRGLLTMTKFMLKAKSHHAAAGPLSLMGAGLAALGYLAGCHPRVATRPVTKQVVVLGFDGADPKLAAKWMAEGKLPNLARLAREGTFKPLGTTNPPESPVAWASFATGLNPGGTGIYDFLKRDPETYLPELALVSRERAKFLWGMIPLKAPKVTNLRSGVPFYKAAADAGYKTTVIRMPLEFPPTTIPGGKLWAGLGVPDLRGTWGTFFYFSSDLTPWDVGDTEFGGKLVRLELERQPRGDNHRRPRGSHQRQVHAPVGPHRFQGLARRQNRDHQSARPDRHARGAAMERLVPRQVPRHAVSLPELDLPVLHFAGVAGFARVHVGAEPGPGRFTDPHLLAARLRRRNWRGSTA